MSSHKIKIGIIGYDRGNGHPYSWSAIINGINKKKINSCPYKIIKNYLRNYKKNKYYNNFEVTHIFTENKKTSKQIANFSKIKNICNDYKDLRKHVDVILVLIENKKKKLMYFKYFSKFKKTVFLDKSVADTKRQMYGLYKINKKLLFGSALIFSKYKKKINNFFLKQKKCSIEILIGGGDNYKIHALSLAGKIIKNKKFEKKVFKDKLEYIWVNKYKKIKINIYKKKLIPHIILKTSEINEELIVNDFLESFNKMILFILKCHVVNNFNKKRIIEESFLDI